MSFPQSGRPLSGPVAILLLVVRGVLLWLLVPIAFLTWLVAMSWRTSARAPLGQCVGWFDLNLYAVLPCYVFGPLIPEPSLRYIPWRRMPQVTHRVRLLRDAR